VPRISAALGAALSWRRACSAGGGVGRQPGLPGHPPSSLSAPDRA
jgi:hypothetical protein